MGEITIKFEDVVKRMDETFMETLDELANETYDEVKKERIRKYIRETIETSSYSAYLNVICAGITDQIFERLSV